MKNKIHCIDQKIHLGVLQGSILGPNLFMKYMNISGFYNNLKKKNIGYLRTAMVYFNNAKNLALY